MVYFPVPTVTTLATLAAFVVLAWISIRVTNARKDRRAGREALRRIANGWRSDV